jgi:Dolichyl-phosphate-mannose-protein mannosyltransferase
MSGSVAGLVYLQVLFLAIGIGLLPLLSLARSMREIFFVRIGLAYPVGVAATSILAAHLALVHVPLGLVELTLLAVIVLAVGLLRASRIRVAVTPWRPVGVADWLGLGGLGAAFVLLIAELRALAIRPLLEFDGWAIWAMKGRALYEFGGTYAPVFTSDAYPPLQHPLLLPSLEAIDFRAMGAFDAALLHVQLVLLAGGFVTAFITLLGRRVPLVVGAIAALAILSATGTVKQLSTAMADVPLAFFAALGVVGLARWLADGDSRALVCAALFLGAATITKSEGAMFAVAAFVALAGALALRRDRTRLAHGGLAFLAVAAILAPWRLFVAAHHLKIAEYSFERLVDLGYLSDHADRVGPASSGLLDRIAAGRWGALGLLVLVGLAAALVARRHELALFAALWVALSYVGLVLIYWISNLPVHLALQWSAGRTVATIVLGGAALSPLLTRDAWALAKLRTD